MADSKCHLLNLPAELRNEIWQLVLLSDFFQPTSHARPPSILQTSIQVRSETLPIHYGQTTFVLDLCVGLDYVFRWLHSIDNGSVQHIRRVQLTAPVDQRAIPFARRCMLVMPYHEVEDERLVWDVGNEDVGDDGLKLYKLSTAIRTATKIKDDLGTELARMLEQSGTGLTVYDWRRFVIHFARHVGGCRP
ncbi:hypothetical protein LTR15_003126 [Elasticomyces elasticus]|nr:hypothetical protein LTR15_003126 [Elasticomyces elasticus]